MKKTLIITAGLPGVGKSYLLRLIKSKLKCYYFDSDLFSKLYAKKHKISEGSILHELANAQPIKRIGTTEEVANVVNSRS